MGLEHSVKKRPAPALHAESMVLDAHCDALSVLSEQGESLTGPNAHGQVDLARLRAGGVKAQFFAAYIALKYKDNPVRRALDLIDLFEREMENNKNVVLPVRSLADLEQAMDSGRMAAFLSVEGGEALAGSLAVLRVLYRLGVRSLTLTWNERNDLGVGVGESCPKEGLTDFGVAVVREMNALGMLVDVSHLSEQGFWEVLQLSRQPVIASHSNCRALCEHPRNLNDAQIKALAEQGGVMGITFVPDFLGPAEASIAEVVKHIEHALEVGGAECVGLGSDFDGTDELPAGLFDCSCLPLITSALLERGHGRETIKKVLGENFINVIRRVIS